MKNVTFKEFMSIYSSRLGRKVTVTEMSSVIGVSIALISKLSTGYYRSSKSTRKDGTETNKGYCLVDRFVSSYGYNLVLAGDGYTKKDDEIAKLKREISSLKMENFLLQKALEEHRGLMELVSSMAKHQEELNSFSLKHKRRKKGDK